MSAASVKSGVVTLAVSAPAPADDAVARDTSKSDFERLGGEAGLRAIMREFVGDVFGDAMIGFLFVGKSESRITELEYRFAAQHLGGPIVYDGRPLGEAHRGSPISSGHFDRRAKILADAWARHGVPDDIQARWAAHIQAQRALVLGHHVDACEPR